MNKVILIGRLTADPELSFTPAGKAYSNFCIAVNRDFKNEDGERSADFINISVWGKLAENVAKYMAKGRQIAVVGRLQIDRVQGEAGKKDVWYTKVIASNIEFLGSGNTKKQEKPDNGADLYYSSNGNGGMQDYGFGTEVQFNDSDLPF